MTAGSIQRVQEHHDRLRSRSQQLVRRFYQILFDRQPQLRQLFPKDLAPLYLHFDRTLAVVIDNLGRIGTVDQKLQELGAKHLHWGAGPAQYIAARDALLIAIEEQSGDQWSEQLAADWRAAINAIIVSMLRSAAVETARVAQTLAEERGV